MTARHKKKRYIPPEARLGDAPAPAAKRDERLRGIWISFWISMVFTFLLLGVKSFVEKWEIAQRVESISYDVLQLHLTPSSDLPVVVLDISSVPMRPGLGATPELLTDREPLRKIVEALAAKPEKERPEAIGLDVDFSPSQNGYAYPDDGTLFDDFLKVNATIPVRVGVNRSLALGPQKWLGDPKYMDLATCVVVPNPEKGKSAWYMPNSVVVKYGTPRFGGLDERCPALGYALANITVKDPAAWLGPFAETFRQTNDPNNLLSNTEFLVDYSALEKLISSTIPAYDPVADAALNMDVAGKIVILGRTKNTTDTFVVPGRPEHPYAGVFLHACAAYTLKHDLPLYHLTELGRIVMDVVFSLAIFGFILGLRLFLLKRGKEGAVGPRTVGILSALVALGLVIGAVSLVRVTHLMWDDFLLVAVVLVAHTPVEETTVEMGKGILETIRSWRHPSARESRSHSEGEG